MYKRKGLKIIDHREYRKRDTVDVSNEVIIFADEYANAIRIDDTGIGGGVTDQVRRSKRNVVAVNFASKSKKEEKYNSIIDEMWFEFAKMIDDIDIPNDRELFQELTGRQYTFNNKGQRVVESKDKFKLRYKRSPDKADALLLCFFANYKYFDINKFRVGSALKSADF